MIQMVLIGEVLMEQLGDNSTAKYYFETKIVGASGNWWSGVVGMLVRMSETDAKILLLKQRIWSYMNQVEL